MKTTLKISQTADIFLRPLFIYFFNTDALIVCELLDE